MLTTMGPRPPGLPHSHTPSAHLSRGHPLLRQLRTMMRCQRIQCMDITLKANGMSTLPLHAQLSSRFNSAKAQMAPAWVPKNPRTRTNETRNTKLRLVIPNRIGLASVFTSLQPPTKKELKETKRDSARLAADQPVSIPRNGDNTRKYTFQHLFTTLAAA